MAQMLIDTPEVLEADRVTGEDCFLAKAVACIVLELENVIDRFQPYASDDAAIILVAKIIRLVPNCPRPQTTDIGWKADIREIRWRRTK